MLGRELRALRVEKSYLQGVEVVSPFLQPDLACILVVMEVINTNDPFGGITQHGLRNFIRASKASQASAHGSSQVVRCRVICFKRKNALISSDSVNTLFLLAMIFPHNIHLKPLKPNRPSVINIFLKSLRLVCSKDFGRYRLNTVP